MHANDTMPRVEHLLRATARGRSASLLVSRLPRLRHAAAAARDRRAVAMRASSTAAAAPAPTSSCSTRFGRAYGFDLSAVGLRLGREAGRTRLARATVTAAPFPSDVVRSRHVVRRPVLARGRGRARGDRRDVSGCSGPAASSSSTSPPWTSCAATIRCSAARCGATAAPICAARLAGAGFDDRAPHLHERHAVPAAGARAGPLQRWRGLKAEGETRAGDLGPARADQRAADRAVLRLESLLAPAVRRAVRQLAALSGSETAVAGTEVASGDGARP